MRRWITGRRLRETALTAAGLGGIAHELIVARPPRLEVLLFCASLAGWPGVRAVDRSRRTTDGTRDDSGGTDGPSPT